MNHPASHILDNLVQIVKRGKKGAKFQKGAKRGGGKILQKGTFAPNGGDSVNPDSEYAIIQNN
jgi:hypothetical protein